MADGYFPTLISKDKDPNIVTNPVFVELTDGSTAAAFTGTSLNVDVTNTVAVSGTFWPATQPVSGTVTANQGTAAAIGAPWTVQLSDGTAAIGVSGNPLYVTFTSAPITGEVHSYLDTTTVNHDYTVVTALLLKSVYFSCSGGGKAEVQVGPLATLVTKWVGFVPKAGGTVSVTFDPPIEVPTTSTGTVRVIRTNRESSAQDLYSTIIGIDA